MIFKKVERQVQNSIFIVSTMLEDINKEPPHLENFENLNDHLESNELVLDEDFLADVKEHLGNIKERLSEKCVENLDEIRFVIDPFNQPTNNTFFSENELEELRFLQQHAKETINDFESPYEFWSFMSELYVFYCLKMFYFVFLFFLLRYVSQS